MDEVFVLFDFDISLLNNYNQQDLIIVDDHIETLNEDNAVIHAKLGKSYAKLSVNNQEKLVSDYIIACFKKEKNNAKYNIYLTWF